MAEAGSVWVSVIPSMRGFTQKVKSEVAGLTLDVKVNPDLTNFRQRIQAAAPSVTVRVDPDLSGFRQRLQAATTGLSVKVDPDLSGFRQKIERTVSGLRLVVKVDADVTAARARIAALTGGSVTVNVNVDIAAALAILAGFSGLASSYVRDIHVGIDLDTGAAIAKLVAFAAFASSISIGALGTGAAVAGLAALVAAIAPAVGALALLPAAAGAAGLAIGTIKTGFSGFGSALKAMGEGASSAGSGAQSGAAKTAQAASQISAAQDRVQDAYRNVDTVRRNVDEANARSARQVAQARQALAQAQEQAAERVADAERQSAERVAAAQKAATRAIESALKQQAAAQRTLRKATADLAREQRALTAAWEEGRRALQDLQDQVDDNALDQRQAALDLKDAQRDLAEARASGDTDAIERAQLAYDRQVESIDQLNKQTQRLGQENGKAQAAGVAGSKAVVEQQDRIREAQDRVTDASRAASEADRALSQARIEGAQSIAAAQAEGQRAIAKAQQDGARQVAAAQSALTEAQLSQQAQQRQGQEQIAAAQRGVTDAQKALADAIRSTGSEGAKAADKAAEALAKLSPNARAAALAIMGLKPAWDALKLDVQDAMFAGLATRISALGNQYIPILRGAMVGLASDMNGAIRAVMDTFAMPTNASGIQAALGNIRTGIANILMPTGALTQAFINLFTVGSTFFPQIGTAIGNAGQRFADFINTAARTGELHGWIQNALTVLGQLWQILKNVGSVFVSIFQAASASGGNLLGVLVNVTGQVAAFFNSAQGSQILQTIFTNIATAVKALMPLFSAVFGTLMTVVLPALSSALPAIGQAFGSLAPAVAPLGQAIAALAPVLAAVMTALAPVVSALVTALSPVIQALAPLISVLAGALGSILVSAVNALAQPLLIVAQILTATLSPVLPVIAQLFGQIAMVIGGALVQVLSAVAPLFPILAMALVQILQALMPIVPILGQFISIIVSSLAPILPIIVQLFVQLVQALLPLLPPIFQLVQALLPIWVSMLNILVPILGFLARVLGGVLVFAVQTLVAILGPLIQFFAVAFGAAVAVATAIFNGLAATFRAVGGAVSWFYYQVIVPVFGFLKQAAAILITALATILFVPFKLAFDALAIAVRWFYNEVIVPVWTGIRNFLSMTWGWIRDNIWNPLVNFIRVNFGQAFVWFRDNLILPVWNSVRDIINRAWLFIRDNIWNPIVGFLRNVLGPVFVWLRDSVVVPVWNRIRDTIEGVWNFLYKVFDAGKRAVNAVGDAFQKTSDWIRTSWDRIKAYARDPVKWVVDVVYNRGIMPVWNGIAGVFGAPKLGPVNFAEGGIMPGYQPGVDRFPAMLSGGEGILVPEAVRALGPAFIGWANRTFSGGRSKGGSGTPQGGGYSKGGIAHFADGGIVGDALRWVGGKFKDLTGFLGAVMGDPVKAVRDLFSGVMGDNAKTPGAGMLTGALKNIPPKMIEFAIKKAKDYVASMLSAGGGANMGPPTRNQMGHTREICAAARERGIGHAGAVIALMTGLQESGVRILANPKVPASLGFWHEGLGRDHDSVGIFQQRQSGWGTLAMRMNARASAGMFLNKLGRGPYGDYGRSAQRVQVSAFPGAYSKWRGKAEGMVSAAGYDRGGIAGGKGFMPKYTLRPERVLSPRQTVAFEQLVPMLDSVRRSAVANTYGPNDFGSGAASRPTFEQNIYPRENQSEQSIGDMALRRLEFSGRFPQ